MIPQRIDKASRSNVYRQGNVKAIVTTSVTAPVKNMADASDGRPCHQRYPPNSAAMTGANTNIRAIQVSIADS
tara:strand:+ start:31694 stop:31912 length:219 start_codon:yes stop_codon:yes gene_type:complete